MTTQRELDEGTSRALMPAGVRYAVLAGAVVVLGLALYLITVRGEALLVDLSALGARIFCF